MKSAECRIQEIARLFALLQEERNLADYDRSERFKRFDVLTRIVVVKERVAEFDALPFSDDKKFFLACLWAWKELANR